jgi:pimeloyl-ACP methyl ester carboxylesterase
MRALAVLAAATAFVAATPAAARATLPWAACPGVAGFECARLDVPLDRSGGASGTVPLAVARVPAAPNPRNVAVVALAGGPGQAALDLSTDFADVLSPALADRDLMIFDQRGTGLSGSLDCPALRQARSVVELGRSCARQLGPARAFFRTQDSVADLEALRAAAGYDKLVLFGVSYGTKVAEAYAARHPDRVEALVLDSVVLPEGPDPFRRSSLHAVTRVTSAVCAGGACRRASPAPNADIRRLAAGLRKHALRGKVVDSHGRRRTTSMNEADLFGIFLAGDLNPTLRAELPGAIRAALHGDRMPILRLSARSAGLSNGAQSAGSDSEALFLATTCEEQPFPWTRGAPEEQRAKEILAAADALPASAFAPFGRRVALTGGVIPLCLGWPTASPAPEPDPPLPQVPTLVLDGVDDVRTPLEDARALADRIPGARVIPIPFTGHSVLGSDLSACARQSVADFFGGRPAQPCAGEANPFAPTPKPPRRLGAVAPVGVKGRAGRTLAAVRATVVDARRQVIGEALALGTIPSRVGGLRGGTVSATSSGYRLRRYEYVPGVIVDGRATPRGAATVTVRGPSAVHGRLTVGSGGPVRGRRGGRRVATSVGSAAGVRLPTPARVLALPRLR